MGATKTKLFTQSQNRLAELAKALGHPARIAILEYLVQKNSCVCGDIVEELPLSQSTVSQHLKALKAVGIIQGEISGVKVCYCINPKVWLEVQQIFGQFMSDVSVKCC